jgi:hypothetical protein
MQTSFVLDEMAESGLAAFNGSMASTVCAHEMFDARPFSDVLWDRKISEELLDERSVSEVI